MEYSWGVSKFKMDISSDVNDIVENFSCLIKNASFGASVRLNHRVHQKKKRKHNKVWHDDDILKVWVEFLLSHHGIQTCV